MKFSALVSCSLCVTLSVLSAVISAQPQGWTLVKNQSQTTGSSADKALGNKPLDKKQQQPDNINNNYFSTRPLQRSSSYFYYSGNHSSGSRLQYVRSMASATESNETLLHRTKVTLVNGTRYKASISFRAKNISVCDPSKPQSPILFWFDDYEPEFFEAFKGKSLTVEYRPCGPLVQDNSDISSSLSWNFNYLADQSNGTGTYAMRLMMGTPQTPMSQNEKSAGSRQGFNESDTGWIMHEAGHNFFPQSAPLYGQELNSTSDTSFIGAVFSEPENSAITGPQLDGTILSQQWKPATHEGSLDAFSHGTKLLEGGDVWHYIELQGNLANPQYFASLNDNKRTVGLALGLGVGLGAMSVFFLSIFLISKSAKSKNPA